MNKTITKFLLLALGATVLFSCNKSNPPYPYDFPVNYYLAVNDADSIAVYKDTTKIFSYSALNSHVNDIILSDNKLELCGYVMENLQQKPALWVDGVLSKPLADSIGCFNSLIASGVNRYFLANIVGKTGRYGALVKNDEVVFSLGDTVVFDKLDIGTSGDFYIAGRIKNKESGLFNQAYLWRISASDYTLAQAPLEIMSSDKELTINDLEVGRYCISVAIEKKESASETSAWGWLYDNRVYSQGQCVKLSDSNSRSCAAMFAAGCWYTGGAIANLYGTYDATIWRNGRYTIPMHYYCNPGGSYVALLYYDGYNTYECVSSPGQIQLCRAGQLRLMIYCPTTTIPAAWLVVRK